MTYPSCWQYFDAIDTDGIPTDEQDILTIRAEENDGCVVVTFNATEERSVYIHLTLDDVDTLMQALSRAREDAASTLGERREQAMYE